jgi:N-acetylmuramate 1-kinase
VLAALYESEKTSLPPEAETFVREWLGSGWSAHALHGDASVRQYYRIAGREGKTCVLAYYPEQVREQVGGFIRAYEALAAQGRVPEVLRHCPFAVAQRDVGDVTLYELLESDRPRALRLYRQAIDLLVAFQRAPGQGVNPPFTAGLFFDEMEMAREFYVRQMAGVRHSESLVPWFKKLADKISLAPYVLCHRDYHGQNLHVLSDNLYMIDYQDMRMGPDTYDLASLLHDRGVADRIGEAAEQELIEHYRLSVRGDSALLGRYYETLLQRSIKILGTFSRQPIARGKMHYLDYIPSTLGSIRLCLRKLPEYAAIEELLPLEFSVSGARAAVEALRAEGVR